jgi:hypothetical protein
MNDWIMFLLGALIGIGLGSYFTALAKPKKQWSELTKGEKKIRLRLLVVATILFTGGVVVLFLFKD